MPSQGWHKETHPPKEKEQKPRSRRLSERKNATKCFFSYLYGKRRKTLGKQQNRFASLFSRLLFCFLQNKCDLQSVDAALPIFFAIRLALISTDEFCLRRACNSRFAFVA